VQKSRLLGFRGPAAEALTSGGMNCLFHRKLVGTP
jgi:hypothetical protein